MLRVSRAIALLALVSCGGAGEAATDADGVPPPAAMTIISGDAQTGTVGNLLPDSLVVRVTDAAGGPVSEVPVTWSATAGNGSLQPQNTSTDNDGRSVATWSLGPRAGEQRAEAAVEGIPGVEFTVTATAGAPTTVTVTPVEVRLAAPGAAAQLTAIVTDDFGNELADANVTWASTDSSVVTVDRDGWVTGQAGGGAMVTAVARNAVDSVAAIVARGIVILVDEAHNNLHSIASRTYGPLAELLDYDGFDVRRSTEAFTAQTLAVGNVLVISNALDARNAGGDWSLPTPSAFSSAEVGVVRDWVAGGGALMLVADHMPFPGAAQELGAAFGIRWNNGFAFDTLQLLQPSTCLADQEVHMFRRTGGSLVAHPVTDGRGSQEQVDSVGTFTGSAFQADSGVALEPLLVFGATTISLMPDTAWVFRSSTPRVSAAGWYQAAVLRFGEGRAAFLGEAAMFTAQTCGGGTPMGWSHPRAAQNVQLALNMVRWLVRTLDPT